MTTAETEGLSAKGAATRARITSAAFALFEREGFEAATIRDIAREAGVSQGLVYRYYDSKEALVLELYDGLSAEFEQRVRDLPRGSWPTRFVVAVRMSLEVLRPHRQALRGLMPLGASERHGHLFGPSTGFSRERVQSGFVQVVRGAQGSVDDVERLGVALYLIHLAVVLFWLVDRSVEQAATARLLDTMERVAPVVGRGLMLPGVRPFAFDLAETLALGIFGAAEPGGEVA